MRALWQQPNVEGAASRWGTDTSRWRTRSGHALRCLSPLHLLSMPTAWGWTPPPYTDDWFGFFFRQLDFQWSFRYCPLPAERKGWSSFHSPQFLSSVDKYILYQLLHSEVGLSGTSRVLRAEEAISIDFFNFCLSPPTSKGLTSGFFWEKQLHFAFITWPQILRLFHCFWASLLLSPFLSILNMPDDFVLKYPFLYSHL